MNARTTLLAQLIADSLYVVDEAAVAEAIVARALARRTLPDVSFRAPDLDRDPVAPVRSFRPHPRAPSFRLARSRPALG